MPKQDFIDRLRAALNGRVAEHVLSDTIRYYDDYIDTEMHGGKSEEEVMASLGDPRLLAKTIAETKGGADARFSERQEGGSFQEDAVRNRWEGARPSAVRIPVWVWLIIFLLVAVLILSAVFSVISFLLPVLIPILVIVFLVKLFRDWMN